MRFQAQAVLQRDDKRAPRRFVGILLAGSFSPSAAQDAWGSLRLEAGLVALAPLAPVVTADPADAAALAMAALAMEDARGHWAGAHAPGDPLGLTWRDIRNVREPADARTVSELIALMSSANDARLDATPSTSPYHTAARELERLAGVLFDATSSEERLAEDAALRRTPGDPASHA